MKFIRQTKEYYMAAYKMERGDKLTSAEKKELVLGCVRQEAYDEIKKENKLLLKDGIKKNYKKLYTKELREAKTAKEIKTIFQKATDFDGQWIKVKAEFTN